LIRNNPSIPALRNALRNTLILSSLHQKWWWNDPDCLVVRDEDSRLNESEVQSAISVVGLSGGMFIHSDDLLKVSPQRLNWISRLVPNLGLRGEPLDLLQREMPRLYRVKVEHNDQNWQLVALFNWLDHPANCPLRFSDLGYGDGTELHVFDFWDEVYRRVNQPEIVFQHVSAHGCKLLRISQVSKSPQLVGDTLHVSQGREVTLLRIVEGSLEIETIDMHRRVQGELWISLENSPREARFNREPVDIRSRGEGVYSLKVEKN